MGFGGDDTLNGDDGDDKLLGFRGNDEVNAGDGNDSIIGGDGDDRLMGDAGNDTIRGGQGEDIINGGEGDDILLGGRDADEFIFEGDFGADTVKRFDAEDDVLTFVGIDAGDLTTMQVEKGTLIIASGDAEGSVLLQGVFGYDPDTPLV